MLIVKNRLFLLLCLGLTCCLYLAACNTNNNDPEAAQTVVALPPTSPATATPTATATELSTATGTATIPATATATATQTTAPTATAVPTNTPTSAPTHTPTATVQVTTTVTLTLSQEVYEVPGQFTFQTLADYMVEPQAMQAGISSEDDEILLFMAVQAADDSSDLQGVLDGFIATINADAGDIEPGESFPYTIDGREGLAVDVTGQFLAKNIVGRVAVVSPDEARLFLAYGLAVNERWRDEGALLFEETLATVAFMPQAAETPLATTTAATATAESASTFPLPIPSGAPAAEWEGIPIMPQAIAGADNNGSYSFTIATSQDEVRQFYEDAMTNLGWSLLSIGEGGNGALLMIFQQEGAVASVSIFSLDSSTVYVFLVK